MGDRMIEWPCARLGGGGVWHVVSSANEECVYTKCGAELAAGRCDGATRYSTAGMCKACAVEIGAHADRNTRPGRA